MQVAGDDLGTDVDETPEALDAAGAGVEGLEVFEVADMRTEERLRASGQAEGVLQQRTGGKHGREHRVLQRNRARHVAARATDNQRRSSYDRCNRIVAPGVNVAV